MAQTSNNQTTGSRQQQSLATTATNDVSSSAASGIERGTGGRTLRTIGGLTMVALAAFGLGVFTTAPRAVTNESSEILLGLPEIETRGPGDGRNEIDLLADSYEAPAPEVSGEGVQFNRLLKARSLVESDDPAAALRSYGRYRDEVGKLPVEVEFEIALCHEFTGQLQTALAEYGRLRDGAYSERIRAACTLAIARIHFRQNQFTLVDEILSSSLLHADGKRVSHEQANVLLSLAHYGQASLSHSQDLLDDNGLIAPVVDWRISEAFERFTREEQAKPAMASESPDDFEDSPDVGEDDFGGEPSRPRSLDRQIVEARLARRSVLEQVETLAGRSGLKLVWTRKATRLAAAQSIPVEVSAMFLTSVLDRLLSPVGLAWHARGESIGIATVDELPDSAERRWYSGRAERSLWNASTRFPTHRLSSAILLATGNLSYAAGKSGEADAAYRDIVRRYTSSWQVADAYFNRAKVLLNLGRFEDARNEFLTALDHSRSGRVGGIALLFAGRVELELGNTVESIRPLLKSVAMLSKHEDPPGDKVAMVPVLTLACAWLMNGNPHAANDILLEHREALNSPPWNAQAAFLSSLARYRVGGNSFRLEREGRKLIASLVPIDPSNFFGTHGYMLVGEAWSELGVSSEMAATFTKAVAVNPSGVLKDAMVLRLAAFYMTSGDIGRAQRLYELIGEQSPYAREAQLEIARGALASDDAEKCLSICNELTKQADSLDLPQVLSLMGRVYEKQGDYKRAALCFAGMLPRRTAPAAEVKLQ